MLRKIKITVDVLMIVLYVILMGYYITENIVHEILGVIVFIFFIIHHILNKGWYKALFKGKYNFIRFFQSIINIFLLVCMIAIIVSGIAISGDIFYFLNITITMFMRRLHMLSTSWGFVLISVHIGMHINAIVSKIFKRVKNKSYEYVSYLIIVLLVIFGIYSIINLRLLESLFLLSDFKFYDYEQNIVLFYLKNTSIIFSLSVISYLILYCFKRKRGLKE